MRAGFLNLGLPKRSLLVTVLLVAAVFASISGCRAMEWIEVAPTGYYFQTESGKPLIVIAQNDAITWPYLNDLLTAGNIEAVRSYLAKLKASGVNTMRIMFEYAQFQYGLAENPLGHFRSEVLEFWDTFIPLAEEYGIYLIITPWDPFWMERQWHENPYNSANGGMMIEMRGFLTNPEAIAAQKRRLAMMIDHWGSSPAILAWELMNEIELWWGARPQEISAWITEMANFVRQREQERYGRNHLLTVSLATPFPDPELAAAVLAHPSLDFASTHQYTGPAVNAPENTVDAADAVAFATIYARLQIPDGRPYLDTESGPIDRWIADGDFDAEYYHNMSWAHLASGGAGQGLRWPYRTPHVLSDEMHAVQAALAKFATSFDWRGFVPRSLEQFAEVQANGSYLEQIKVFGIADHRRALLWLLNMSPGDEEPIELTTSGELVVYHAEWLEANGLPADSGSTARIEFWDTYTGTKLGEAAFAAVDDVWRISLPGFTKDLAVVVYLEEE